LYSTKMRQQRKCEGDRAERRGEERVRQKARGRKQPNAREEDLQDDASEDGP
jgi:hypothetical protein